MGVVNAIGIEPSRTTILVVDDHAGFRRFARAFLQSEGFDVVGEAADGQGAIEAASALRPDAILLDVQLPDLDGFEVTRRVLESAHGGAPAVVLVSSREANDYGERVGTSGARGFLPKAELSSATLHALIGDGTTRSAG
jgi:DNA-binding NarL/FixJ family response regulator